MKLVSILGSPRKASNSTALARAAAASAAEKGARVEEFHLNGLSYQGCQGCYACKTKADACVLKDDLAPVLAAVAQADALILASPVYFGDLSSQAKGFVDRTFGFYKPDYMNQQNPSRLPGHGRALLITTQEGGPETFPDILDKYDFFIQVMGFPKTSRLRACEVGGYGRGEVAESYLAQARDLGAALLG